MTPAAPPDVHLLLWRHAEAEDGADDMARPLTARGRTQARELADWIDRNGPRKLQVFASPAVRSQQTAEALGLPVASVASIAPGANAGDLLAAIEQIRRSGDGKAIVLVGHQPALGELAALLVAGKEAPWAVRKGALWWIRLRQRDSRRQAVLYAVVAPEIAR